MRFVDRTGRSRSIVKVWVGGLVDRVTKQKDFTEAEELNWMNS